MKQNQNPFSKLWQSFDNNLEILYSYSLTNSNSNSVEFPNQGQKFISSFKFSVPKYSGSNNDSHLNPIVMLLEFTDGPRAAVVTEHE